MAAGTKRNKERRALWFLYGAHKAEEERRENKQRVTEREFKRKMKKRDAFEHEGGGFLL
jgi:hypothetical protein